MDDQIIRIDNIKWRIAYDNEGNRLQPEPICPEHHLRMTPVPPQLSTGRNLYNGNPEDGTSLKCEEDGHYIDLPRKFSDEKTYVINRIDAKIFKDMKVINLDDEAVPIAEDKDESKDNKYFVITRLMQSKRGLQAVIYAGEKGKQDKTQIFVKPFEKMLTFDYKDINPTDLFLEVVATFDDGSSHTITK